MIAFHAVDKNQLASEFGNAAAQYDRDALVQRQCAAELVSLLKQADPPIPAGAILELGCGTGFVTRELVKAFPNHPLMITDLSAEMLAYCCQQPSLVAHPSVVFQQLDGEMMTERNAYGAIAAGFVVQWFNQLEPSLRRLSQALIPSGMLAVSFPNHRSFPEWKQICEQIDLPFTGNPMPDVDQLCQRLSDPDLMCCYYERWMVTTFDRAIDFFYGLKRIGAGLGRSPVTLSPREFRHLLQTWDSQCPAGVQVSYRVAFLTLQRQG